MGRKLIKIWGGEPSAQLVAKVDLMALQHGTEQRLQIVHSAC
jgi:hypothetical protein